MIVKQRAASNSNGDWAYKLESALAAAGIPREDFDTVEAETNSMNKYYLAISHSVVKLSAMAYIREHSVR
jgi:hypothetical protein